MLFYPAPLITIITFPGVIFRQVAYRFFLDCLVIPVYSVCYFRFGAVGGYVRHAPVQGLKNSLFVAFGPFIVSTIFCALITFSTVLPLYVLEAAPPEGISNGFWIFFYWVGFSIGMQAFPSDENLSNLVSEIKRADENLFLLLGLRFFVGFLQFANALKVAGFNAAYAILVTFLLPWSLGLF